MIRPRLERIEIPPDRIGEELRRLEETYMLPNGEEVPDGRTMTIFRKQIAAGYYYQLRYVDQTIEEIREWYEQVQTILGWHKLGVV